MDKERSAEIKKGETVVPQKRAGSDGPAPMVQGNSGPAHFSVWFSLVVRVSQ